MIDEYDRFPSESELYSLGLNKPQIDGMAEGLEAAFLEDVEPLIEPDEDDEAEPNLYDEDDEAPTDGVRRQARLTKLRILIMNRKKTRPNI